MNSRTETLLTAPPLPLLLSLTAPNTIAFAIQAAVNLTEVWIVGQLGTQALAAMALVFPLLMLTQTMSGGALGGAISSAIARALGTGNRQRGEKLVWHGIYGALAGALVFLLLFIVAGEAFLTFLGGDGTILSAAMGYCWVLYIGGPVLWINGAVGAVFRGSGDMAFPAKLMIASSVVQVPLTAGLVLGLYGLPQLGVAGAAWSSIIVAFLGGIVLLARLASTKVTTPLRWAQRALSRELTDEILLVARPAALNPLMTVGTILGLTAIVGSFGPEALAGYGIGTRIEYIMLPVVFAFGTALTTIVGTNIGAGNVPRAERAAWYGVACTALLCGTVGILLAIFPSYWIPVFTNDPVAYETARGYILIMGPAYAFLGIGLVLYFAAQGAGAMAWPIFAMIIRFILAVGGAQILISQFGFGVEAVFITAAVSMAIYASINSAAIYFGAWRNLSRS
jgi:putative MATE family efflux protein